MEAVDVARRTEKAERRTRIRGETAMNTMNDGGCEERGRGSRRGGSREMMKNGMIQSWLAEVEEAGVEAGGRKETMSPMSQRMARHGK